MNRRILVIPPLYVTETDSENIKEDLQKSAWANTTIDVSSVRGNIAVNSRSEADIAAFEFLKLVVEAEKRGYDAVISYCYGDVGVDAAKEKVKIPVVGPLETSAIAANMLGSKFSLITIETAMAYMPPRLRGLGLDGNYVSIKGISLDKYFVFSADPEQAGITRDALMEESKKAIAEGANVIVLACTGFPRADNMRKELKVPIIESSIAMKMAEALTDLRREVTQRDVSMISRRRASQVQRRKPRIKFLVPTSPGLGPKSVERLKTTANPGTQIDVVRNKAGPRALRTYSEVAEVAPFIIRESAIAQREGYDAVVLSSFEDPALASAREVAEIPVIGFGETSMLLACLLGSKFSIVREDASGTELIERVVRKVSLEKRFVSTVPVTRDVGAKKADILERVKKAVNDGAKVIVTDHVEADAIAGLARGKVDAFFLNPALAALKVAEAFHSLGLSHSKIAYPKPILPAYHMQRLHKLKKIPRDNMFLYGD